MCFNLLHQLFEFCSSLLPSIEDMPFKVLELYGFWSFNNNWNNNFNFYHKIFLFITQFIISTVLIGQVLFLLNEPNVEIAISNSIFLIPIVASYCRQLNLLLNKKRFANVENKIREYKYLGYDNKQMRIKNYYNNRLRFMNHFIVMTFTLFGVVHSITSWLGHNYPIPIWIPHEINMIIPFWILFIYSSLSCWIHIMLIMSYDLMFSGHLTLLAMHLDILKYRFAIIPKLNKLNRKIYLTQCIQYQQYIYELSENVQDAFFTTNSACTFSVGISLCLGVFKLSVDNLYSLNTWACIQFILAVFVKWAIQCWEATIVMQKSIEIGDAAYNLNWIDFNKPTAITVMIIIRRSSVRPIIFYGILAITLSVNTLKTVGSASFTILWVFFGLCLILLPRNVISKTGLCEASTGQSIIVDIEESRGNAFDQSTVPEELSVSGDPYNETTLELTFPGKPPLFALDGKKLRLLQPLDRDDDNLSHVVFQLACTIKSSGKKRIIPVIVRVSDINDNAPKFINTPYETTVPELTPVGSTIFQNVVAVDADAGVNGLVEYSIAPGDGNGIGSNNGVGRDRITTADGYGFFSINLPHQGQVTVNRTLDFERTQRYFVTILASDRARNVSERFTSTTTLTVNIRDDDDQDPSFIYQGCMLLDGACINPEYSASVSSGVLSGILNISPEKIQAVDMDSINAPIHYSFLSGSPANYRDFFEINLNTGAVKQIRAVDTTVTKKFDIIIKAVEMSEAKRSATAKLSITVKPVDSNPPVITASTVEGFVDENAPVGTKVIDKNGNPIKLTVSDADLGSEDPKPNYAFELTTNFFAIDQSGILVVNEENLDRDPPSPGRFRFQVIAREKIGIAASTPLSFVVTLNDVNDNAPQLPMVPPITVQAGETRQEVIKVEATDNDEGENAEITYSIYHVSNNGLQKFKIDPKSGVIESVRKLNAGEQFSITVQATDKGGKYSQTIVEVNVIPGPNTRSPIFQQPVYEVQVSEGASINSTVATITALDPENDPVSYAIVSGNDLRQFAIGDKSGVITVIRKLDREDLTRYQLLIKAEDSGGLSSTATVNIRVTDINDKNPEFEDLPYEFEVKEGEARKLIGRVHADDADEGINAEVKYFAPDDIPFTVDPETGDVLTKIALDYEQNHDYKFVVTARDGAPDHRLATATVTVKVIDVEDEIPIFHQSSYEAKVKENVPDYMVIQVVADDPDTKKQITYMIKQGDTDLFSIDPKTGVIKTLRGLDYERDSQHILIIGTLENTSDLPGSTTRVVINVQDMNDIPPVFTSVPRPITLDDDVPIGTTVINLLAQDSDGTSPGNQVRYEIIGRGIANKYFVIDPDSGILTVRDDLRKETDSEYQVDVRAYDLGEPQLSSVTTVPIYVRHVATVAPEVGLGFAEDSYNVDVPEDAGDNTLIKILTIINSHNHDSMPLKCEIYSGNNDGIFEASITEERNCALRLKKGVLDYETVEFYQIKIKLESLSGFLNSHRNTTMVKIQVIDVNDNKPEFVFPEDPLGLRKRRYFATIPRNTQFSPSDSHVLQVKAHDKDNGKFGKLEYKMLEGRGTQYFTIDSSSGIINNVGTFDSVLDEDLPFKFNIQVRDNPNLTTKFNTAEAPVVVNLIDEKNLLILVIQDASHDVVQKDKTKIMRILEEKTGLLIGIEKIAVRKTVTKNGTVESHPQDSDVWFYTIDPKTETILDRNSSQLQRIIFDKAAMSAIIYDVSTVVRANAIDIHPPVTAPEPVRTQTAVALSVDVYPYALIIVACIILVLGIAGIIYICISWSRYKAYKDRMQRMYVVPRYDPVFVETDLKEYETQVLRMSVPNDDNDSFNDLQLDFSNKNHAFSLDNVSYITKDHNGSTGQQSPVSSEAATTVRASSIAGNHPEANIQSLRRSTLGRKNTTNNPINTIDTPVLNPLFNHTDLLSASPSNDNVTFRERKDYSHLGFTYLGEQSPVETTTEL